MTDALTHINALSSSWFDTMWAVIWQSTLLVIAVSAALRIWRAFPAWRCWTWRIFTLKLLTLPFWIVNSSAATAAFNRAYIDWNHCSGPDC